MKRQCLHLMAAVIIGAALLLVGCAKKPGVHTGELVATVRSDPLPSAMTNPPGNGTGGDTLPSLPGRAWGWHGSC